MRGWRSGRHVGRLLWPLEALGQAWLCLGGLLPQEFRPVPAPIPARSLLIGAAEMTDIRYTQ